MISGTRLEHIRRYLLIKVRVGLSIDRFGLGGHLAQTLDVIHVCLHFIEGVVVHYLALVLLVDHYVLHFPIPRLIC